MSNDFIQRPKLNYLPNNTPSSQSSSYLIQKPGPEYLMLRTKSNYLSCGTPYNQKI